MTVTEIIEAIEKLSPEERRELVRQLSDGGTMLRDEPVVEFGARGDSEGTVAGDFRKIADKVFSENEELFRKLAQ